MIPEIRARSLPEANDDLVRLAHRSAVVSIGEPGSELPYGFKQQNPLHLRLEFHDVIASYVLRPNLVPPGPEHVEQLLKHAPILRTADIVYCHCNAGISRSTATAFILRCLWMGPGHEAEALQKTIEDREIASPNPLMIRYADEQMERERAMIRALEEQFPELRDSH